MAKSQFVFHSLGLVAKDSREDSPYIDATPIEHFPNIDGDISTEVGKTITSTDLNGGVNTTTVVKTTTVTAKWLAYGNPNRITPPMVCKGETVGLYKFGDSDKYFWVNLYNEVDLRKREKVIYAFSNKLSVTNAPDDPYYTLAVDTINKHVSLHTSISDGEYTTYDIQIDTSNGKLIIEDGKDNLIMLDSKEDTLTINTNENIKIATKNITQNIEENLDITLQKLSISNGGNELISVLSELVSAMMSEQHIGNLGAPTSLSPGSSSKYEAIKAKIDSFKK